MFSYATRRSETWRNIPATVAVEIGRDLDGAVVDLHDDRPVPAALACYVGNHDWAELIIDLRCSGYYDPGQFCGPPERCYPPEGADDREVERAAFRLDGEITEVQVPASLLPVVESHWQEAIAATEIDHE